MTTLYSARWVLPISSPPIEDGALAVENVRIAAVGKRHELLERFPAAARCDLGDAAILPGFVNSHTHLELTAMRGFLDSVDHNFSSWLKKLTLARLERMTPEDLYDSAVWGAAEAARAGITSVGDSSDSAFTSMRALRDVGLRAIVFQESFGPDPKLASQNFEKLQEKVARLRELQTPLVSPGVSPHAPYTVCGKQLEMIAEFALREKLPVMMHAAESDAEERLMREGQGPFAEGLASRGIEWTAPKLSTIEYLQQRQILDVKPLLAHCVNVNETDVELMKTSEARVAHCPRSNAKLGHGRAPLALFVKHKLDVGVGSDSVASNNSCDVLAEARFAILLSRIGTKGSDAPQLSADDALQMLTLGGARALQCNAMAGELKVGFQADFTAIDLSGTHQTPSYDPIGTIIFSSSGSDVLLTAVAGRVLYEDGRITTVDEDRLRARIREIANRLTIDQ